MVDQNQEDLFGKLPDSILCQIISFLPAETALETSLLSTRWRGLWNSSAARRSAIDAVADNVAEFVSGFEETSPLRRPRRLRLHLEKGNGVVSASLAPKKLHLDFGDDQDHDFGLRFALSHENGVKNIRHLHLKSVGSLTSEAVSAMVSGFRFLESLKIVECNGLKSLSVDSGPGLAKLSVYDCRGLEFLQLKCSKLRCFRYRGKLPRIRPETHFNLADAMLDFRQGLGDDSVTSSDFDPVLLTVKNSEVVTLCKWTFEALIWPSIYPLKESFRFYKLKELWWIDYSDEGHDSTEDYSLIYFLKLCPALEKLFITVDSNSFRPPKTSAFAKKFDSKRVKLRKLRVVKMSGFTNQENEMRVMKQIRDLVTPEPLFISASNQYNCSNLLVESFSPKHSQ